MLQDTNRKILLLAVVLGLITSLAVFFWVTRKPPEEKKMVDVIIAKTNITPGQVIKEEMLEAKKMPAQFVHPLAYSSPKNLLGRMVKEKIVAGEVILKNRVFAMGADSSRLSLLIPPGQRAVTVAVNDVSGVAGMLQPGDCVDILSTFDKNTAGKDITSLVLQNIAVLAVGQETESKGEKSKGQTTVTVLVSPWQAEQLALAEEKGILRLALRPFQPEPDVFTTNVVLSNLTRLPEVTEEAPSANSRVNNLPTSLPTDIGGT